MLSITANHKAIHDDWQKVLDSGVFTEGPFVRLFEEEVSKLYGMPAVAFNSAGTALFSVMRCMDFTLRAAFVPVNSFFATGAMVREARMTPVLTDASLGSFCMELGHLQSMWKDPIMRNNVSAVVHTPVGGGICRHQHMDIAGFAASKGLTFIDDAAHSLGIGEGELGKYGPAVFSIYPTKAVPGGEGGVVITDNIELEDALRDFRNYGKYRDPETGVMEYDSGFNFRMDEWTAVVAYHQMKALPEILDKRRAVAHRMKSIIPPMVHWRDEDTNWYRYIIEGGAKVKNTVGKVYARTDQMDYALGTRRYATDDNLYPNAVWLAENHQCLGVFETMFDWPRDRIEQYIFGEGEFANG